MRRIWARAWPGFGQGLRQRFWQGCGQGLSKGSDKGLDKGSARVLAEECVCGGFNLGLFLEPILISFSHDPPNQSLELPLPDKMVR